MELLGYPGTTRIVASCEKMKNNKSISFLPESVIFNILVWLPADILYNVMRFVCRNWYNIIRDPDFIEAHLIRSAVGLFVQNLYCPLSPFFLDMVNGTDKATRTKLNFRLPESFAACCDGLVLFCDPNNRKVYHIVNPITRQQVSLAPLPASLNVDSNSTLACAPSTREYKVLYVCDKISDPFAVILTVGVDNAWRSINTEHIRNDPRLTLWCKPLAVLGFIYWWSYECPCVLALDVKAEIIYEVPLPKDCERRSYVCMKSESSLALGFIDFRLVWGFWELMEPKTKVWRKLFDIDLESQAHVLKSMMSWMDFGTLKPIALLKNREVVIFFSVDSGIYISYNVKGGKVFCYWKAHGIPVPYLHDTHVNSLVVLKS